MHFYFKKRTRKRAIKKSEHVCAFVWLQSSNSGQLQIAGGGEWPDSSLRETGPPYRISITSDDLFFTRLPSPCLPAPSLHVLLSYLSVLLMSSPLICLLSLALPLPHTPPPLPCSGRYTVLSLVARPSANWIRLPGQPASFPLFTSLPQNN